MEWKRNMIANMESGRRDIRMSDFLMISKAPNIPPERLPRFALIASQTYPN